MGPMSGTKDALLGTLPRMEAAYQGMANDPSLQLARNFNTDVLSGRYLDPASNPYLQRYAQGAMSDVANQFNTMAMKAGRGNLTGSDMQQNLASGLASAALPIYYNAYNTGMTQLQNAANNASAFNTASYGGATDWLRQGLQGVGGMGQSGTTSGTTTTTPSMGQYLMGGLMTASSLMNPAGGIASLFNSNPMSKGQSVFGGTPWSFA